MSTKRDRPSQFHWLSAFRGRRGDDSLAEVERALDAEEKYGSDIPPRESEPGQLWIVIAVSLALCLVLVFVLRKAGL